MGRSAWPRPRRPFSTGRQASRRIRAGTTGRPTSASTRLASRRTQCERRAGIAGGSDMRVHINIYDPRCVWGRRDTVGRTIPDFLFLFCQPSETRGEGSGFALYFFVIFGLISEQLLTARRRSSRPIFGAGYADRRSGCDDGKSSYAENRLDARLGAYLDPGASLFRLHRLILSGKVNGIQRFEGSSIEISSSFLTIHCATRNFFVDAAENRTFKVALWPEAVQTACCAANSAVHR